MTNIFQKRALRVRQVVENKVRIQEGQFLKSALIIVLIADSESTQTNVHNRTGIIDLQNEFNILVANQWTIRLSVPMSYIRLFENLAVLEKWYGMEGRSVMEPAVLLLVSLPCTIGIELRSCPICYEPPKITLPKTNTTLNNIKNVENENH